MIRRFLPLLLVAVVGTACKKPVTVAAAGAELAEDELVTLLRARAVPDKVNARFSIKMKSKPLGIAAPRLGGGLVVERPDRAYVALLDPVGSPVLTLASNGEMVAFTNRHDKQFVSESHAKDALAQATGDAVTLDQLVSMLLGLLPLEDKQVRSREVTEGGVLLAFDAPGGVVARTVVDPAKGTPTLVEVDKPSGGLAVRATYQPFEDVEGHWMPTEIDLEIPHVELTANIVFKQWKVLETAPDVFSPTAPEGYAVLDFATFVDTMGSAMGGDDETPDSSGEDEDGAAE